MGKALLRVQFALVWNSFAGGSRKKGARAGIAFAMVITAAALAIKGNDAVRNVSTARLKSELEAQGVWFDTHNK